MIVGHPENIRKFASYFPTVKLGDGEPIPLASMEIVTDSSFPKTRKTGRLIWQKDPFVTYEDSDRQWGLALGFCEEEEEEVVYHINDNMLRQSFELEMNFEPGPYFSELMEKIVADICKPRPCVAFNSIW